MPALSIIPFILHLMTPVPLPLQESLNETFIASPMTLTEKNAVESSLTFTTKLGSQLPVPVFAELERSMSNMVRIYYQNKDESHVVKKVYFYAENCKGELLPTKDKQKATVFQIRNEDDDLHKSNFHISCLSEQMEGDTEATEVTESLEKWRRLSLSYVNKSKKILKIVVADKDEGSEYYSLVGMITPYYMQDKIEYTDSIIALE